MVSIVQLLPTGLDYGICRVGGLNQSPFTHHNNNTTLDCIFSNTVYIQYIYISIFHPRYNIAWLKLSLKLRKNLYLSPYRLLPLSSSFIPGCGFHAHNEIQLWTNIYTYQGLGHTRQVTCIAFKPDVKNLSIKIIAKKLIDKKKIIPGHTTDHCPSLYLLQHMLGSTQWLIN